MRAGTRGSRLCDVSPPRSRPDCRRSHRHGCIAIRLFLFVRRMGGRMNRLLTVFLLALATTVQAHELKIDETDELIIVEYVGTPSAKGGESEKSSVVGDNADVSRVKYLTARI